MPDSFRPNELITIVMVRVVTTGYEVFIAVNPSGPDHTIFNVIGTSTTGFNSTCTMQVRVIEDPMGRTGLCVLLVIDKSEGDGTAMYDRSIASQ